MGPDILHIEWPSTYRSKNDLKQAYIVLKVYGKEDKYFVEIWLNELPEKPGVLLVRNEIGDVLKGISFTRGELIKNLSQAMDNVLLFQNMAANLSLVGLDTLFPDVQYICAYFQVVMDSMKALQVHVRNTY